MSKSASSLNKIKCCPSKDSNGGKWFLPLWLLSSTIFLLKVLLIITADLKTWEQKKALCSLRLLPSVAISLPVLLYIWYTIHPRSTAQSLTHNRYLIANFLVNINVRGQNRTLKNVFTYHLRDKTKGIANIESWHSTFNLKFDGLIQKMDLTNIISIENKIIIE